MRARSALAAMIAVAASAQAAGPGAPRSGSGILGVPDAETLPAGWSVLSVEGRLDRSRDRVDAGLAPTSAALGLGRIELAASLREGGVPGDPRPSRPLGSGALKVHLLDAGRWTPALAIGVTADRINEDARGGVRLLVSTGPLGTLRLALAGGFEAPQWRTSDLQPTGAAAASIGLPHDLALLIAGHATPGGPKLETGVRWSPTSWLGISAGFERLPDENVNRFVAGISVAGTPRPRRGLPSAGEAPAAAPPAPSGPPTFPDERPRFRLRLRRAPPAEPGEKTPAGAAS
jgi:hypothetical protein